MFGEFFFDQISEVNTIILSRAQQCEEVLLERVLVDLKKINDSAHIFGTPWDEFSSKELLSVLENQIDTEKTELRKLSLEHTHDHELAHEHHDYQKTAGITSVSLVSLRYFSKELFRDKIGKIADANKYGVIIRGKGYFSTLSKECYRFDYVLNELNLYKQNNFHTSRMIFIGKDIRQSAVNKLFY